jgi:serine/threonine protein kinase
MANPGSLVGAVLCGRYRLTKLIGQGGMGSVYEAFDRQMADRLVAVKVLAAHLTLDETQVTRFEQEARAANQLRHPHTISVLDYGHTDDGHLFMVLEYLHGETLTQVLRHGPLAPARALSILRQICKSLAEAHAMGIIHRDLKPDNIFVCEIYGEKDFVKVIDFGIAKLAVGGAELTQVGKMFGTPRYLSPEQAQGLPLAATSDLYSLGVILFEMLTGQAPFHADDSLSIALKHVQEPAPALRDVGPLLQLPQVFERVVAKMLAKKPAQRFQSAEEVLAAVDECLEALGPAAKLEGPRTPTRPKTIPPVPAPREATPVVKPAEVQKLDEAESTKQLQANEDATQMLAAMPDEDAEATRAISAMDRPLTPAATDPRVASAPKPANATPTPANARQGGEGHTLALEVEDAPSGGVQVKRPERPPQPKRRSAPQAVVRQAAAAKPAEDAEGLEDGPNKLILLAVAIVLAAVGGGGAWLWVSGHAPQPTVAALETAQTPAAAAPVVPEAPPEPQVAAKLAEPPPYSVEITSDPPGASVTIDGMPAGTTPVPLKLSASAGKMVAVLTLAGHDDYRLEIDPQKLREAGISHLPIHLVVAKPQAKAEAKPAKPAAAKTVTHKPKIEW